MKIKQLDEIVSILTNSIQFQQCKNRRGIYFKLVQKWITNGSIADLAIVWAKDETGTRGFIVESDSKGFSAPIMHGKWSKGFCDIRTSFGRQACS